MIGDRTQPPKQMLPPEAIKIFSEINTLGDVLFFKITSEQMMPKDLNVKLEKNIKQVFTVLFGVTTLAFLLNVSIKTIYKPFITKSSLIRFPIRCLVFLSPYLIFSSEIIKRI